MANLANLRDFTFSHTFSMRKVLEWDTAFNFWYYTFGILSIAKKYNIKY